MQEKKKTMNLFRIITQSVFSNLTTLVVTMTTLWFKRERSNYSEWDSSGGIMWEGADNPLLPREHPVVPSGLLLHCSHSYHTTPLLSLSLTELYTVYITAHLLLLCCIPVWHCSRASGHHHTECVFLLTTHITCAFMWLLLRLFVIDGLSRVS